MNRPEIAFYHERCSSNINTVKVIPGRWLRMPCIFINLIQNYTGIPGRKSHATSGVEYVFLNRHTFRVEWVSTDWYWNNRHTTVHYNIRFNFIIERQVVQVTNKKKNA